MGIATPLSNNQELYDYLLRLADVLVERGSHVLANNVRGAAQQASGMSTEFLGESRIALEQTLATEAGALNPQERQYLIAVIDQLDQTLSR
jgi:cobalamin biosynthesis Mg chelatase CobN